jgi:serine/threonine protein kinase
MATTPARIARDGTSGGEPSARLNSGATAPHDTEPPGASGEEATEADAIARMPGRITVPGGPPVIPPVRPPPTFGPEPASGPVPVPVGEPTKVGPPPDPGKLGIAPPAGHLQAAPANAPQAPAKLVAAPLGAPGPVLSNMAAVGTPVTTGAPGMPFNPLPTPAAPRVAAKPLPPVAEGTAVGIAPLPPPAKPTRGPGAKEPVLTRRCTSCDGLYPADFLVCPRDATPLVAADASETDPLVGKLIGETYQIIRVIGEGGMGRVYEARHLRLKERRFAVKCLHSELARNPEMAARFLREAESASSIKHVNVVDVFDVHHLPGADGTPYMVGEFLEGEELADYVDRRGPLEPRGAAKVARQVCSALAAAHARGIVHRDMKPENIFVLASSIAAVERNESRSLQVKVLDFGISKAGHGDNSQLTKTGVIMGTPSYMSPEQARGRSVDHRADIYSLGACLYFMVTGRRPFDSDDPTSTLSMVLTEDPVRPREIDQRIPEMLELIIQRAMAKDAQDRYASMADLEKALNVFTGRSSLAVPSGHAMVPVPPSEPDLQASGTQRALDVAKAMLGSNAIPSSSQQSTDLARTARPTIVLTSAALGAWLVGATVAALAGLVRVLHDGEVTITESLLLVVGCLFAAATPIALYVIHLRKVIWPNSVRALQLATDLKRISVAALVAYGGLSIFGRIVHTVLWRSSRGLASGLWDIALFVVGVSVALSIGGVAPLLRNLRRRRPTRD